MDAVNRYSGLDYPVTPTLFFEFHGSEQGVREQVETVGALAEENTGGEFRWATRSEDRSRLWQARHDAYYAALALRPGAQGWPTDVCVPISNLAECILETRADIDASGLLAPIVGHVGDGNFHLSFILDPDDADELARAEAVNERMVARGPRHGRHLHRRARHRLWQDRISQSRARKRGGVRDAAGQAGSRSRKPDESGKDTSVGGERVHCVHTAPASVSWRVGTRVSPAQPG